MPRYLLSSRAILDIAQNKGLPAQIWFGRYRNVVHIHDELFVSSISRIQITAFLDGEISAQKTKGNGAGTPTYQLKCIKSAALDMLDWFKGSNAVLSLDEGVAEIWGAMIHDNIPYRSRLGATSAISFIEKIELATAINGIDGLPLYYVVENQRSLNNVNGLKIEDLNSLR